ncbi:conserved hypothetical protein [Leptospira interrogans serovar Manilae]|uniref:Uncharacterized protein n=1 Tax=Leptospira interrogans serovar Manilae TaxID=214675 RepID=A0AAQ1NU79_LEPIR|nr:conserved hypothetical protein [Leptospira interrogans serovar Manilae]
MIVICMALGFSLFEILPKLHVCLSCGYRKSLNWDNPFLNLKNHFLTFHTLMTEFVSFLKE